MVSKTTETDIAVLEQRVTTLHDRCNKKDIAIRTLEVTLATAINRITLLEDTVEKSNKEVSLLISWKNRAIGYLTAIASIIGMLLSTVRDYLND